MCDEVVREARIDDEVAAGQGCERRIARIERDAAGALTVHFHDGAEPVSGATVARCFPWSLPDEYVSVRDSEGKEVVLLKSLREIDADSRHVVERELRERIFNPKIHRLIDYNRKFGVISITAETDRGEAKFQIRSRDDVRVLSATRALFRDADGITYELPDLTKLDSSSRRRLEQYF